MLIGPLFAFAAAVCFAFANASIAKGLGRGGDNGAFLSVLMTLVVAGVLWLFVGNPLGRLDGALAIGIGYFAFSGILSTVVGRLALFKSVEDGGAIQATLFRRLIPLFAAVFAYLILGEGIGLSGAAGMGVILASLLFVIPRRGQERSASVSPHGPAKIRRGQLFGTASACSYGLSFVMRKIGMSYVPDPTLGALIGGLSGMLCYIAGALANIGFRPAVFGLFRHTGRWQLLAASLMSFGQVAQFFALINTEVAVVAIIGSLEVFISIYIAAYVLKTERPPGMDVVVASLIATGGVVLVALD